MEKTLDTFKRVYFSHTFFMVYIQIHIRTIMKYCIHVSDAEAKIHVQQTTAVVTSADRRMRPAEGLRAAHGLLL
jgi:hypothetical protein